MFRSDNPEELTPEQLQVVKEVAKFHACRNFAKEGDKKYTCVKCQIDIYTSLDLPQKKICVECAFKN